MRNQDSTSLGGTGPGLRRYDQARIGLCYFDTDLRLPTRGFMVSVMVSIDPGKLRHDWT